MKKMGTIKLIFVISLMMGLLVGQSSAECAEDCFSSCGGFGGGLGRDVSACIQACIRGCQPPASHTAKDPQFFCKMGCISSSCVNPSRKDKSTGEDDLQGCVHSCSKTCSKM